MALVNLAELLTVALRTFQRLQTAAKVRCDIMTLVQRWCQKVVEFFSPFCVTSVVHLSTDIADRLVEKECPCDSGRSPDGVLSNFLKIRSYDLVMTHESCQYMHIDFSKIHKKAKSESTTQKSKGCMVLYRNAQ